MFLNQDFPLIRASNGSFGLLNIPLLGLGLGLPVGPFPGDVMTVHQGTLPHQNT